METPILEEMISDRARVRVFSHVVQTHGGSVPCWTYMSDGLLAYGQDEVSLSVKREPGEAEGAFPRIFFELYRVIEACAARKQIVRIGGFTKFNPAGPGLLRDDFKAILYTRGQRLEGVKANVPFLTGIALTSSEAEVADRFGTVRMMALLGQHYRFFPTAPWLDRSRPEIARPEAMSSSILAHVRCCPSSGATARLQSPTWGVGGPGAKVVLTMTPTAGNRLIEDLAEVGPDIGLALLVDADPEAEAIFLWSAQQASAIAKPSPDRAWIAGNFLLVSNCADIDGANVVEDGFGLLLTKETWTRFLVALERSQPMDISTAGDGIGFALAWTEEPALT